MPKLRSAMQALPSRDAATSLGHRRRRSALCGSLVWPFGLRSSSGGMQTLSITPRAHRGPGVRVQTSFRCPYRDTTTRVSAPWLVAGNVVPCAARGEWCCDNSELSSIRVRCPPLGSWESTENVNIFGNRSLTPICFACSPLTSRWTAPKHHRRGLRRPACMCN